MTSWNYYLLECAIHHDHLRRVPMENPRSLAVCKSRAWRLGWFYRETGTLEMWRLQAVPSVFFLNAYRVRPASIWIYLQRSQEQIRTTDPSGDHRYRFRKVLGKSSSRPSRWPTQQSPAPVSRRKKKLEEKISFLIENHFGVVNGCGKLRG